MSAVCLERLPVITQEPTAIEKDVAEMFKQIEFEYSCLSDHELRNLEDQKIADKRKQDDYEDTDVVRQTAVEAEDAWEEELRAFTPASRVTEGDKTNDVHTTDRKLDSKLVLLIKQKLGDKSHWVMPMRPWQQGESMRKTAERTLVDLCGNKLSARFMGNAPLGFYKYKYPRASAAQGYTGAKVFFFKAQLRGGQVACSPDAVDFAWVSYDELPKYLTPAYLERVNKFHTEL